MPGMTREERIAQAEEMIEECIAARRRVLRSQAYSNSGMGMTYARLDEIKKEQQHWEDVLNELNGRTKRVIRQVIPRDN